MKLLKYLTIVAYLLVLSCGNVSWQGNYFYEAELGETVAMQPVIVEYELNYNNDKCSLNINGFQVSESILCKAEQNKKSLKVKFVSYADGSTKNKYGNIVYKVDDTLFSLNGDPSNEFSTHWDRLWPGEPLKRSGHYFIKQKE